MCVLFSELEELNQTLSIIDEPEEIVTGSRLTLTCAGSAYFFQRFPSWNMYDKNVENQQKLHNSSGKVNTVHLMLSCLTFM